MITYIIKSSLSLILLFGLYWFLLRKEKLFIFNRFYLVLSVIFSLAVPFVSIPVNFQTAPKLENIIPVSHYDIPDISSADNIITRDYNIDQSYNVEQHSPVNISAFLLALYISGVILFLFRFLRNIYKISLKIKLSDVIDFEGYSIVLTSDSTGPYCFFNNIFIYSDDYLNGRIDKEVLNHELEHVRQSHSIDIIVIELVKIFYWFNPVHHLYLRAIRINHEYLADNGVISADYDVKSYADKLVSFITGRSNIPLTSGSGHSFAKMRLLMMMKSGPGRIITRTRIIVILLIVSLFSVLLSFKESDKQPSLLNLSEAETEPTQSIVRGIVLTVDGKPLGGGTITGTRSDNTTNKSWVSYDGRFTIDDIKPGTSLFIEHRGFEGQTLKPEFGSEMVIKMARDPDYKGIITMPERQNVSFRNPDFTPAKALVVLNGVIIDYKSNLKVNPGEINRINVLKGKEATDRYGDKGKDGVIEIVLNGNETKNSGTNQAVSDSTASDASKDLSQFSVNRIGNKGELIDIPVSNLQDISVIAYNDIDNPDKKELRYVSIMTRDYYKVKGIVVREDGKPLSGVKVSASGNPVSVTSDNGGRFIIRDVREDALLEFSRQGYETYYLSSKFEVAFNTELTIELREDKGPRGQSIIRDSGTISPGLEPLIIIDGVESKYGSDMIPPSEISSVTVLKDKSATIKYGEKGKNGAIIITSKGKASEPVINKPHELSLTSSGTTKPKPLVIVDGIVFTEDINNISPQEIESISVIKDSRGTEKYGEKGRDGVIYITTKKRTAVVASVNMNVIYRGIANPVEIAVPGVFSERVTATTTDGIINRTINGWEVIPGDKDELIINVLVDNKKVTERILRVKKIPDPVAVLAGYNNGSISKEIIASKVETLDAELKDFDLDLKFEVVSFKFLFSNDNKEIELSTNGNRLTDEMRSIISKFNRGQSIIFKDIKAIGPDGRERNLAPIILKID